MRHNSVPSRASLAFLAGALALAVGAAVGCKSSEPRREQARAEDTADSVDQNRLLTRMAFAENVYNGAVAESALYPSDFFAGSPALNSSGIERLRMLVHAYRDGTGRVTVLRGAEAQELYAARVSAVRQQLTDEGLDLEKVTAVPGDHVTSVGSSSGRAVIGFTRMIADAAKPSGGGGGPSQNNVSFGADAGAGHAGK